MNRLLNTHLAKCSTLLCVLLLLCALPARAFFPMNGPVNGTYDASSYSSPQFSPPGFFSQGPYFQSYFANMNPGFTNNIYTSPGHSGANWQTVYQSDEEMIHIALWASFTTPGYDWIQANDNGSYGSNQVVQWGTNIFAFPPLSYNGTAATNQGITIAGITHYALGCQPDANPPGISAAFQRNAASLWLNDYSSVAHVDLYGYLWTNGIATNLTVATGGHYLPDGSLISASYQLRAINVETNVGSLTFDYTAGLTATNRFAVSNVIMGGNSISTTFRADRMPMSWDVPDGTITNDARNAFVLDANLGSSFRWTIGVTNLPAGNYNVFIDGSNVVTLSSAQLASGWNMFTNYNGALWAQRKEVLGRIRDQAGANRVTLLLHAGGLPLQGIIPGVGDMVAFGGNASQEYSVNHKRGTNYLAALATWISQVQQYNVAIWQAAQQTNHTLLIQPTTVALSANITASALTNAVNTPIVLDGGGSTNATSYAWSQISGVPRLDLIGADRAKAMILSAANFGTYVFQLITSDGVNFATNTATVKIIAPAVRTLFVDNTLTANCTTTNYSIANRNGSGSDSLAYTNIQFAANAAQPGDVIYIRGGLYTNNPSVGNQVMVMMTNSGTALAPIRFENYNGESVVLAGWGFSDADTNADGLADGPAYPAWRQTLFFIQTNTDYVQVRGLELTNSQQAAMAVEGSFCYIAECIFHDNWNGGISITRAKAGANTLQGSVVRWCEAYRNRHFTGILLGLEDQSTFGYMSDCAIVDCISYLNGKDANGNEVLPIGGDPQGGGNADGISATKYFADNATNPIPNWGTNFYIARNCVWSNCDDGIDTSCAYSLIEDNRSLFNGPTGPMGFKMFRYVNGMTFRGNVAYANLGRGYDLRVNTNNSIKLFNNDAFFNNQQGVIIAGLDGTSTVQTTNNVAAFNAMTDWPNTLIPNWGEDGANVAPAYRGDPKLSNTNLVLNTAFTAGWTVQQKHDFIEGQVKASLTPATNSPLVHAGVWVRGYFAPTADDALINATDPNAPGRHWYAPAPDMGAYTFTPIMPRVITRLRVRGVQ